MIFFEIELFQVQLLISMIFFSIDFNSKMIKMMNWIITSSILFDFMKEQLRTICFAAFFLRKLFSFLPSVYNDVKLIGENTHWNETTQMQMIEDF